MGRKRALRFLPAVVDDLDFMKDAIHRMEQQLLRRSAPTELALRPGNPLMGAVIGRRASRPGDATDEAGFIGHKANGISVAGGASSVRQPD